MGMLSICCHYDHMSSIAHRIQKPLGFISLAIASRFARYNSPISRYSSAYACSPVFGCVWEVSEDNCDASVLVLRSSHHLFITAELEKRRCSGTAHDFYVSFEYNYLHIFSEFFPSSPKVKSS